jgi:phosphoserine phosphatase RsbU/P
MINDTEEIKLKRNLSALVEFSRIINSSLDLNFILNNLLLTCLGKFFATKGFVALDASGNLKVNNVKGLPGSFIAAFPAFSTEEFNLENPAVKEFLNSYGIAAAEKIYSSDKCVGVLCLGEKLNKIPYSNEDLEFLRTILNISATAIQNSLIVNELKVVNRVLDSKINRLGSLFELSKEFGILPDSARVAKLLVYSVIGQFLVSKFAVIVSDGNDFKILESKFKGDDVLNILQMYDIKKIVHPLKREIINEEYPAFSRLNIDLVVPMQLQGETKGIILLGQRINKLDYSESDIEFIFSVGSLAIISLENKRLFIEALEKQRMEEELEIARDIQRNLLPKNIFHFSNFDISAENISSRQVGGDYYDIIKLNENNFCIAVADVSGKGVPASLLMANIQAFLKVICKQGMDISEATGLINDLITENTSDGKFITFFWGVIDNEKRTIQYVNAGHNPPLLVRNGEIRKLDKGGLILGVMKTFSPYLTETIQLEKDDLIILFTDGISEAMNKNGAEFSDERLEKISIELAQNSSSEILNGIVNEVKMFSRGIVQSDDITLMVLKVK